jgi:hypothetical protein
MRPSVRDIPTFGVPEKIPRSDIWFIVAAGLPLFAVSLGAGGVVLEALGIPIDSENPVSVAVMLIAMGLGPAVAHHFQRGLRASGISRGVGCAALVVWVVVMVVAAVVGPLGFLLTGGLGLAGGGLFLAYKATSKRAGALPPTLANDLAQLDRRLQRDSDAGAIQDGGGAGTG